MSYGLRLIQQPPHVPFKNPIPRRDDPAGDFHNNEVRWMNQDHLEDERLREAGHNDQ